MIAAGGHVLKYDEMFVENVYLTVHIKMDLKLNLHNQAK